MSDDAQGRIKQLIDENRLMLFMKGSASFPQCGFSGQVVQILNSYGVPYQTFNVLDDMEVREGIKVYSDWPTIPQLYVDQTFIGGCDIMTEMHQAGELEAVLVQPPA